MKLFNLTCDDKQFISCIKPKYLPEKNFSFVEINFSKNKINKIMGIYNFEGDEKECVLSDLEIGFLLDKFNIFIERDDLNLDKINLNFVEEISHKEEISLKEEISHKEEIENKILKIFIISLSSYFIYFDFFNLPFEISFDLLTNKMLNHFTSFSPINFIEENWIKQVSFLHRNFFLVFEDDIEKEIDGKEVNKENIEKEVEKGIEKINEEVNILIQEVRDFKKKMFVDIQKLKLISK